MKKLILALAIGFSMVVSASEAYSFEDKKEDVRELVKIQAEKNNINLLI